MKELLLKAGMSGIVSGIAVKMIFGGANDVQYFNMTMDPGIATGIAVGAGSVVSDLVSENIIEKFNLPQNVKSTEEILVRVGVCGAASTSLLMIGSDIPSENLLKAFALGGGSKLGGDYAYQMILSPKEGILPIF